MAAAPGAAVRPVATPASGPDPPWNLLVLSIKSTNALQARSSRCRHLQQRGGSPAPAPSRARRPSQIPVVSITAARWRHDRWPHRQGGPASMTWTDWSRLSSRVAYGRLDLRLQLVRDGCRPDTQARYRSAGRIDLLDDSARAGGLRRSNSGTSMSSPHVAGAVALLLASRAQHFPGRVRSRLQNAADPEELVRQSRAWACSTMCIVRVPVFSTSTTRSLRPSMSHPASSRSAKARPVRRPARLTINNRGGSAVTLDSVALSGRMLPVPKNPSELRERPRRSSRFAGSGVQRTERHRPGQVPRATLDVTVTAESRTCRTTASTAAMSC